MRWRSLARRAPRLGRGGRVVGGAAGGLPIGVGFAVLRSRPALDRACRPRAARRPRLARARVSLSRRRLDARRATGGPDPRARRGGGAPARSIGSRAPSRPLAPPAARAARAGRPRRRLFLDGVSASSTICAAGDAYQVNLSRRLSARSAPGDPLGARAGAAGARAGAARDLARAATAGASS